jgi:signal transduction histidine kinase/heme exporter protein D
MKRFSLLILLAVTFALGAMVVLHRQSVQQHDRLRAHVEQLQQRQGALRDMTVSLEKYRRMSAHFRKMTPTEMDQAKDSLRQALTAGLTQFEKLDPNAEETSSLNSVRHNLDAMMEFAVKFERTAYNKDAYQKAEMVSLHDRIGRTLADLDESTQGRIADVETQSRNAQDHATPVLVGLSGLILALFVFHFVSEYWIYERPLRRMHHYSQALRAGTLDVQKMPTLKGRFGDIQSALAQLAQMVQGHARERHKFILDVVSDLRSPLIMLTEGKHLLGSAGQSLDSEEELRTIDSVKRGLAMLSGSLDDMEDIIEYARLDSRMDENLCDLSELVNEVSRTLNAGPGLEKQISTAVPPMPIWVRLDARRFERVIMQAITKVASTLHQGTSIHVSVEQPVHGSFRGVEIIIQDSERARDQGIRVSSSGPEVDVLKHWISEKGLGMTLAHRVIKTQGGTITASGMPGTSVQIAIRLPQERLAQVGLISAPRGLEVKLNQVSQADQAYDQESGSLSSV